MKTVKRATVHHLNTLYYLSLIHTMTFQGVRSGRKSDPIRNIFNSVLVLGPNDNLLKCSKNCGFYVEAKKTILTDGQTDR